MSQTKREIKDLKVQIAMKLVVGFARRIASYQESRYLFLAQAKARAILAAAFRFELPEQLWLTAVRHRPQI